MEDKHEDYCSIPHEYWYEILFDVEVTDNRKRSAAQIKRLETSKATPVNSDSNDSIKVPCKKKFSTGVLPSLRQHG